MSEEQMANQSQEMESQAEETQEAPEQTSKPEQTTASEEAPEQEQQEQEPFLRIKYNKEEKPLTQEEAIEYAQKGMNYDKVQEKLQELQNNPALSLAQELAEQSGMTVEQWAEAVRKQQEQDKLNQLVEQQGIPEDVAREIIENRKFRQWMEQQDKQRQREDQKRQQFMEFNKQYPDVDPKAIPEEVWQAFDSGTPLIDAYTRHENQILREKVAKLEQGLNVKDKNQQNADKSTGSTTGEGNPPPEHFSREQVDKMSDAEVARNLDKIKESMKHW